MRFKDYINKKFKASDIKLSGNPNNIRVTCIDKKCEDRTKGTKHKLHIDLKTGMFHCFRCGLSGIGLKRFIELNEGISTRNLTVEDFDKDISDFRKKIIEKFNIPKSKIQKLTFPESYVSAFESKYALNYIRHRGIKDEVIEKFKLGWCSEGDFAFRVMFPSFNKNEDLIYYSGRSILGTIPKSLNVKIDKNDLLYGSDFLDYKKDFIVITEGPFSCITVNDNAVALYSKNITPQQLIRLRNFKFKKFYIMLDGDAREQAVKLAESLLKFGKSPYIVKLADKDPNDLGYEECWKLINSSKEFTEKNLLMEKLEKIT